MSPLRRDGYGAPVTLTAQAPRAPEPVRRRPWIVVAAASGAAALYGINGSVSKVVLNSGLPSPRLSELRATGAMLCLLVIASARTARAPRPTKRELPELVGYGVVGIALVQALYFVAIQRLHVGVALLFEFTAPVFIVLWTRFGRRRHVSGAAWLGLLLSLAGLALVAHPGTGAMLDATGVAAGLGASLGLAVYYVLGESLVVRRDVLSLTTWAFVAASGFWSVVQPWPSFPWHTLRRTVSLTGRLSDLHAPVAVLALGIILLGTVVPYLLVLSALKHLPATRVGVLGMLEPVLATAAAWAWLQEGLTSIQIIGGAVLLVGVSLVQFGRSGLSP